MNEFSYAFYKKKNPKPESVEKYLYASNQPNKGSFVLTAKGVSPQPDFQNEFAYAFFKKKIEDRENYVRNERVANGSERVVRNERVETFGDFSAYDPEEKGRYPARGIEYDKRGWTKELSGNETSLGEVYSQYDFSPSRCTSCPNSKVKATGEMLGVL